MLQKDENPDIQVRIKDLNNVGHCVLKRINPNGVHWTLQYHLNLINDNTELRKSLVYKAKKYNNALLDAHLTAKEKRMAYTASIMPPVTF